MSAIRYLRDFLPRKEDYSLRFWREDVLAGITVAVVAIPLALGFGVTSGAGAAAGLYTAIVAGIVAALFGGSSFQVSGPTGAMTVVLLPILARYGVEALFFVGLLAGLILVLFACLRVGRYVHYIPWPVVTGFTNGIAIVIFLQQLPGFLGVPKGEGEGILIVCANTIRHFLENPRFEPALLAWITLAVMYLCRTQKRLRAVPAGIVALAVGTALSFLPFFESVPRIGALPEALPIPHVPLPEGGALTDLFRAALAVAALAALESLLSAIMADGMTIGERHDPNRELFGQGLANVAASLFGGVPATAAIARTAVNVRSGARTRLSAVVHGAAILLVLLFAAPLAARIPLAVLAGILMATAMRMLEWEALRLAFRSTRSDAAVLLVTMGVTVVFDLILAIEVGLLAACILFIVRVSKMFEVKVEALDVASPPSHEGAEAAKAEEALLAQKIVPFRVEGALFFGATNRFFTQLLKVGSDFRVLILRMRRVPVMDVSGVVALQTLVERLEKRKVLVLISGLQSQPREILESTEVLSEVSRHGRHLFPTTEDAIQHALLHLKRQDHLEPLPDELETGSVGTDST